MTVYTIGARQVLLDTSPFFRFAEAGQLLYLARYLGKKAFVTLEVEEELRRNSGTYRDLQMLDNMRWPPEENRIALQPALMQELFDILRGLQAPGDHALKHAGEISTAMLAAEMTALDHLTDDLGFSVYDLATPNHVGRAEWSTAVERAKAATSLPPSASASGSER